MVKRVRRPQRASGDLESGGHGSKSEAVRERAILALLSEKTLGAAAEKADVGERTLRRWLAEDAAFRVEYDAARAATFQAGMNRVQALTAKAVETLEDLLGAEKFPAVRLGAARTVAEIALQQHDSEVIMRKLEEIEQRQQSGRR